MFGIIADVFLGLGILLFIIDPGGKDERVKTAILLVIAVAVRVYLR